MGILALSPRLLPSSLSGSNSGEDPGPELGGVVGSGGVGRQKVLAMGKA